MAISNGGGEEQLKKMTELGKTLNEGERILAPTRRPDGTLRKPIRIRAGYVPQEEVAIYQSKGALWKKEMASQVGPPGYDPTTDAKPKSKSAKRNERKKEKRLQASLEKEQNSEAATDDETKEDDLTEENLHHGLESVKSLTSHMTDLTVSQNPISTSPSSNSVGVSDAATAAPDLDKKIRALKKKIRLQHQKTPHQDMKPEKLAKVDCWHEELKLLEDKKAELAAL